MDQQHGIFGWIQPSAGRLGCQVWITVAADLVGNLGLVAVMKYANSALTSRACVPLTSSLSYPSSRYVPGTIVAVTLLLGPIIATLEGLALGTENVPGLWTIVGAAVNIVASTVIAADAQHQSKTVQLKELKSTT